MPASGDPARTPADDESIYAGYEVLLGRRPAEEEVALHRGATFAAFLESLVASPEYGARHTGLLELTRETHDDFVNVWTPELARFHRPAGTLSANGAVEIGREGFIFLNDGANHPRDQFVGKFEPTPEWTERWARTHRHRTEAAAAAGAQLIWLMIPDKTAVLHELITSPLIGGRRPVERLLEDVGIPFVYPHAELSAGPASAFLRTDSHLSAHGTRTVADVLTSVLGAAAPPAVAALAATTRAMMGDLGWAFQPPIAEIVADPGGWPGRVLTDNSAEIFAAGGHFGARVTVANAEAPDRRRVAIFGDSFSFAGRLSEATYLQGLIWWLAFTFREIHFCWIPFGWDQRLVDEVRPEVIVLEGAERFAVRPPQLDTDSALLARQTIDQIAADPWTVDVVGPRESQEAAAPLTAEEVTAIYRQVLRRPPTPREVAMQRAAPSVRALLEIVVGSDEFQWRLDAGTPYGAGMLNVLTPALAAYGPPAGTRSRDGLVEVGPHCDLRPVPRAGPLAHGWLRAWRAAHDRRTAFCDEIGADFVWVLLPEKPDRGGTTPAELLRDLSGAPFAHPALPATGDPGETFALTSRRLTEDGLRRVAVAVLALLGEPHPPPATAEIDDAFVVGDLGAHFRPALGEIARRHSRWPGTAQSDDDGGVRLDNAAAAGARTCAVVAAGDARRPGGLAWWLACAFREVHVLPRWDERRLRELAPDILVCETPASHCESLPEGAPAVAVTEEQPLVSIVTPTLNQAAYIEETLRSVAQQDYPLIDHIVMDAGSTDGTAEIVARFGDLVRFHSGPDDGQADAINKGFRMSRGTILGWLNSDDVLLPGAVRRAVETLRSHPDAAFVHGGAIIVDVDDDVLAVCDPPPFLDGRMLLAEARVIQPTAFWPRTLFEAVGGLRTDLHYTMDWDLFLKLARHGPMIVVRGDPLAVARLHPESKTVTGGLRRYLEILRMLRAHGGSAFATLGYGLELLDRWATRVLRAAGGARTNTDVLVGDGPLSRLRRALTGRLAGVPIEADRWVGRTVELPLPVGEGDVIVTGDLPPWCPLQEQTLTVDVRGGGRVRQALGPGRFELRCPAGHGATGRVRITAGSTFVPARHDADSADRRRLAWVYESLHRDRAGGQASAAPLSPTACSAA